MIVGNCCSSCQRHTTTTFKSSSSSAPSHSTGATLSTGFRRATTRRVRFEAADAAPTNTPSSSLPQRLRASAAGLARAAIATPDLNALSASLAAAGRGTFANGKLPASNAVVEPSTWAQTHGLAGRPYWEQESCSYGYANAHYSGFRSVNQDADQAAFQNFYSGQQPSLLSGSGAGSSTPQNWRDEFLTKPASGGLMDTAALDSNTLVDDVTPSSLDDITQDPQWDEDLKNVVEKLLPNASRVLDSLEHDSGAERAKTATFDPNTVKRLRMILQHLTYAPCPTVLSVR